MGLFADYSEYGDLVDSPINDGFASYLAATVTEAVGFVLDVFNKTSPARTQTLLSNDADKLRYLADINLAASLRKNLSEIADQATDPNLKARYERLAAEALADGEAALANLRRAVGVVESLTLKETLRRAWGSAISEAVTEGMGRLAGPVYTVAKIKDIVDNDSGKTEDEVVLAYRKELWDFFASSMAETTQVLKNFVATGSTGAVTNKEIVRFLKPSIAGAEVITAVPRRVFFG